MPEPAISFVAEAAARYDVPRRRLQRALWVVAHLIPEELALLDELSHLQELDPERRRRLARGLRGAVEEYCGRPAADPFAEVDEPLNEEQAVHNPIDLAAAREAARGRPWNVRGATVASWRYARAGSGAIPRGSSTPTVPGVSFLASPRSSRVSFGRRRARPRG